MENFSNNNNNDIFVVFSALLPPSSPRPDDYTNSNVKDLTAINADADTKSGANSNGLVSQDLTNDDEVAKEKKEKKKNRQINFPKNPRKRRKKPKKG